MSKRKKYEAEAGDDWSIPKQYIEDFISLANRPTTETNRVRLAVLMTEALLEAGTFRKDGCDLNQEMFRALCFERDLYAALKETKWSCKSLVEELMGYAELVSKNWNEPPNPENELMKKTLNLIEEMVTNGQRRGISKVHPRESTSGVAGNKQKATRLLETGIRPSVHTSIKKFAPIRDVRTPGMDKAA